MTVVYEPGVIRVSSWHRVLARRDIEVWAIECNSKYASWFSSSGDEGPAVYLIDDERTLRTQPGVTRPTVFSWPYGKGWEVFAVDGGRYEVRACLWKRPKRRSWLDRAYGAAYVARHRLRALTRR